MSNTSSKTTRFILIVCITLAVIIVAIVLMPRGISPDKAQTEESKVQSRPFPEVYAAPAKAVMLQIVDAAKTYYAQKNIWPSSVQQLEQAGLIAIPDSVSRWWQFAFSGGPVTSVSAMSTDSMPDGPARPLTYRPATGKWFGYGTRK